MWSRCPWVARTAIGLSRCSRTTWATPSAASLPGSITTHSVPGPVAATKQLVPHGPAGKPAINTDPAYRGGSAHVRAAVTILGHCAAHADDGYLEEEPTVTSTEWGRVDDDGTVYVKTADGERPVGQYPAGTPEEAMKFFTERYAA